MKLSALSHFDLVDNNTVVSAQEFANSIVEYTEAAKDAIEDVRKALSQLLASPLSRPRVITPLSSTLSAANPFSPRKYIVATQRQRLILTEGGHRL